MIVQFSLLPDVKVEYLKARRQQHVVMVISIIVATIAVVVLSVSALTAYGVQRKTINDLTDDIASKSKEIKGTKDLSKILTVQEQLKSLPNLHTQKPAANRVYVYLSQITPVDVSIARFNIDFATRQITITGNSKDMAAINKFVDTLKFTKFKEGDQGEQKTAFPSVVLTSFTRSESQASYSITMSYEAVIFDNAKNISLDVPNTVSTRSEVEKPAALFDGVPGGER